MQCIFNSPHDSSVREKQDKMDGWSFNSLRFFNEYPKIFIRTRRKTSKISFLNYATVLAFMCT